MAEIIDFLSIREKYKKKGNNNVKDSAGTKVIKADFTDTSKAKKFAENFLIEDNFGDLIYDCVDKNTVQQVYLYLLKSNQELAKLEHDLAKSVLDKHYNDTNNAVEYFNKQKNKEQMNQLIKDNINLTLNVKDCYENYFDMFSSLERIMDNTIENLTNADVYKIVTNEQATQNAEKAMKYLEEKGEYKGVVDTLIDKLADISHYINSDNSKVLMEDFMTEMEDSLNFIVPNKLSTTEAYIVLDKIINNCADTLLMNQRLVNDSVVTEPDLNTFNTHHLIRLEKKKVAGLIKQLQANEKAMGDTKSVSLTYKLKPITERLDLDRESTIAIDTYELETDFLYNIVRYQPKQITAFTQFLAENKIVLPLTQNRLTAYVPVLASEFDDKFLDRTFVINNGSRVSRNNIANPEKYRKTHGITLKDKK